MLNNSYKFAYMHFFAVAFAKASKWNLQTWNVNYRLARRDEGNNKTDFNTRDLQGRLVKTEINVVGQRGSLSYVRWFTLDWNARAENSRRSHSEWIAKIVYAPQYRIFGAST